MKERTMKVLMYFLIIGVILLEAITDRPGVALITFLGVGSAIIAIYIYTEFYK